MQFIDVTAQFNSQGEITPLKFTWQGRDFLVESTGRSWKDEAGYHILVMVPSARIFELVFDPTAGRWHLDQIGAEIQTA
jgi:hypothetical protein